jgi:hypothetical protein
VNSGDSEASPAATHRKASNGPHRRASPIGARVPLIAESTKRATHLSDRNHTLTARGVIQCELTARSCVACQPRRLSE